jgi:hypothetical protein
LRRAHAGASLGRPLDPVAEGVTSREIGAEWDVAYGLYPHREHIRLSTRMDECGPLETRQIYSYGLGFMQSGDIMFNFNFVNHVFACNLSRPPAVEYVLGFNTLNPFTLRSRWTNPAPLTRLIL